MHFRFVDYATIDKDGHLAVKAKLACINSDKI